MYLRIIIPSRFFISLDGFDASLRQSLKPRCFSSIKFTIMWPTAKVSEALKAFLKLYPHTLGVSAPDNSDNNGCPHFPRHPIESAL